MGDWLPVLGVADAVWLSLISTLAPVLATLATGVLIWVKAKAAEKAARAAAFQASLAQAEAGRVKADLTEHREAVAADRTKMHKQMDEVTVKVEEVHKATNSLTDRLVELTDREAHARGVADEKKRADERERRPP